MESVASTENVSARSARSRATRRKNGASTVRTVNPYREASTRKWHTSSFSVADVAMTSEPRPVVIRKNTSHTLTLRSCSSLATSANSRMFEGMTVVLICIVNPSSRRRVMALIVESKCPSIPRTASWVNGDAPSRLSDALLTPTSRSDWSVESARRGVTDGAIATGTFTDCAYEASSTMSSRIRQSPPVRIRIGRGAPIEASESMSPRPSFVLSSPGAPTSCALARQWKHAS